MIWLGLLGISAQFFTINVFLELSFWWGGWVRRRSVLSRLWAESMQAGKWNVQGEGRQRNSNTALKANWEEKKMKKKTTENQSDSNNKKRNSNNNSNSFHCCALSHSRRWRSQRAAAAQTLHCRWSRAREREKERESKIRAAEECVRAEVRSVPIAWVTRAVNC